MRVHPYIHNTRVAPRRQYSETSIIYNPFDRREFLLLYSPVVVIMQRRFPVFDGHRDNPRMETRRYVLSYRRRKAYRRAFIIRTKTAVRKSSVFPGRLIANHYHRNRNYDIRRGREPTKEKKQIVFKRSERENTPPLAVLRLTRFSRCPRKIVSCVSRR